MATVGRARPEATPGKGADAMMPHQPVDPPAAAAMPFGAHGGVHPGTAVPAMMPRLETTYVVKQDTVRAGAGADELERHRGISAQMATALLECRAPFWRAQARAVNGRSSAAWWARKAIVVVASLIAERDPASGDAGRS
jgi:hypothetical protein